VEEHHLHQQQDFLIVGVPAPTWCKLKYLLLPYSNIYLADSQQLIVKTV